MILSDKDIQEFLAAGDIKIDLFNEEHLRSGSYSLTLGNVLYRLKKKDFLDLREERQEYDEISLPEDGYLLQPNEFILGRSKEHLYLSENVAAFLSARGSRAQVGLSVLLSSMYAEPGTSNHIAFEIQNVSAMPIKLSPGLPIVKVVFMLLKSTAEQKGRGRDFFNRHGLG